MSFYANFLNVASAIGNAMAEKLDGVLFDVQPSQDQETRQAASEAAHNALCALQDCAEDNRSTPAELREKISEFENTSWRAGMRIQARTAQIDRLAKTYLTHQFQKQTRGFKQGIEEFQLWKLEYLQNGVDLLSDKDIFKIASAIAREATEMDAVRIGEPRRDWRQRTPLTNALEALPEYRARYRSLTRGADVLLLDLAERRDNMYQILQEKVSFPGREVIEADIKKIEKEIATIKKDLIEIQSSIQILLDYENAEVKDLYQGLNAMQKGFNLFIYTYMISPQEAGDDRAQMEVFMRSVRQGREAFSSPQVYDKKWLENYDRLRDLNGLARGLQDVYAEVSSTPFFRNNLSKLGGPLDQYDDNTAIRKVEQVVFETTMTICAASDVVEKELQDLLDFMAQKGIPENEQKAQGEHLRASERELREKLERLAVPIEKFFQYNDHPEGLPAQLHTLHMQANQTLDNACGSVAGRAKDLVRAPVRAVANAAAVPAHLAVDAANVVAGVAADAVAVPLHLAQQAGERIGISPSSLRDRVLHPRQDGFRAAVIEGGIFGGFAHIGNGVAGLFSRRA